MDLSIKGTNLTIRFMEDDGSKANWNELLSWQEAIEKWQIKAMQVDKTYIQIHLKMERMSDGARLRNPDHFNTEGNLPDGKKFYAIKQGKIRAYGWFSSAEKGIFIISHFAFKKGKKLDSTDTNRVVDHWRKVERGRL